MSRCPCSVCSISVRNNPKSIYCDNCSNWTHLKCTKLSNNYFIFFTNNNEHWFCSTCLSNIFPFNSLVDYFDFLTCLYSFSHCNKPNLIKNSHQLCLTSKYKPCNSEIDPDKFYYNQMQNKTSSSYYLEDEFNSMLIQRNIYNNVSVLHVNARSLHKNLDYLQVYLRTLNHNFNVIAISETWANNDSMSLLNIPGYNSIFKN